MCPRNQERYRLKEIANLSVRDNVLLRNRIGVSFDTVPHGISAFATFRDNLVAFNHVALPFQPSTERVELVGNGFDRNGTQIEVRGGGDLAGNAWSDERGNYWSDYVGYDADGDLPYRPRSLFESLSDEDPVLSLFNYGPSAIAVDFAARAVSNLRPDPKVVDEAPLLDAPLPGWFAPPAARRVPLLGLGGVLLAAGAAVATIAVAGTPLARRMSSAARSGAAGARGGGPLLEVTAVTKRYGARTVLDAFSLELRRGEAVALWGGNGAGKTTAIRCLLDLAHCEGEVVVDARRLARDPGGVRRRIGYVPQDAQLPDLPAGELLRFFGALRGVAAQEALAGASLVGIEDHLRKRPRELSGGLRQRLALALALLGRPPLLLLFLGDLGLMATVVATRLDLRTVVGAALVNPAEVFKIAVIDEVGTSLDALGLAGNYLTRNLGAGLRPLLVGLLLAWGLLPALAAVLVFRRTDAV